MPSWIEPPPKQKRTGCLGKGCMMLVTFLIPISAILLGTVALGERLAPHHFAGMALIALGLAAIDGRLVRMVARIMRVTWSDLAR